MTTLVIGVGIDTARYGHHVSFLDQDKRPAASSFHFKEGASGFQKLRKSLDDLVKKHPQASIRVHLDPAGSYANNLVHFLQKLSISGLSLSMGHPERNKKYREFLFGRKKADPVESLSCARLAISEKPVSMPVFSPDLESLKQCVSAIEAVAKQKTQAVNQLHCMMANAFPQLSEFISDISSSYCLKLLEKYPTAKRIAAAKIDSILAIPHMKEDVAKAVHGAAKCSTACVEGDIIELLVQQKVKLIQALEAQHQQVEKTLEKAWKSLPEGPYKQLHTITGFGIQTAASLVAKIGDIQRFETPAKLIGYFGCFPELRESGTNQQGEAKSSVSYGMAAQGNDLVRRNLYMAAQSAAQHNPAIKALYARQRQLGKDHGVAIGHCMAKLLRIAYALWVKNESFDPKHEATKAERRAKEKNVVGSKKEVKPQRKGVTTTSTTVTKKTATSKRQPLNFAILKSQISVEDILTHYGWKKTTEQGAQMRGQCPLCHHADERGFAANRTRNVYCCHRCGKKGNVVALLSDLSGKPFHEAAWDWIDIRGMKPPLL